MNYTAQVQYSRVTSELKFQILISQFSAFKNPVYSYFGFQPSGNPCYGTRSAFVFQKFKTNIMS